MDMFTTLLTLLSLGLSIGALAIAFSARQNASASRVKRLEMELVELADLVDQQSRSLKKLHGRAATREAREARHAEREQPSDDPLDRRPGETAEQWKQRINRNLSPIRRN